MQFISLGCFASGDLQAVPVTGTLQAQLQIRFQARLGQKAAWICQAAPRESHGPCQPGPQRAQGPFGCLACDT